MVLTIAGSSTVSTRQGPQLSPRESLHVAFWSFSVVRSQKKQQEDKTQRARAYQASACIILVNVVWVSLITGTSLEPV